MGEKKVMKKLILKLSLILFVSGTCLSQNLSKEEWLKDIQYLDKKIEKQFVSFDPTVKSSFKTEIDKLRKEVGDLKDYQIACEIMRLMSLLKDGHTELNIGHTNVGFIKLPLLLYFFEDSLYVIAAHQQYQDLIGKSISHFNGMPTSKVFAILQKRMSADNDMEYYHAAPGYLILPELLECIGVSDNPKKVNLSIGSKIIEFEGISSEQYSNSKWASLYSINSIERPIYLSGSGKYYWHKYLEGEKTMYFNFTRVNNQKGKESIKNYFRRLFDEIDQTKPEKLIIDFRLNNGGNYGLSRPLIDAIVERPWLNQSGKIWVVNGRRTFSAASVATIYLKTETEAIVIGEPGRTHPNWSDNNEYMNLPNSNYLLEYTTRIKKHWPEKPELDRIPVDVYLPPNFQAYQSGEDVVMSYILKQ